MGCMLVGASCTDKAGEGQSNLAVMGVVLRETAMTRLRAPGEGIAGDRHDREGLTQRSAVRRWPSGMAKSSVGCQPMGRTGLPLLP